MKAIILARVSSNEQEYGKSLEAQLVKSREYAQNKGLDVIKEYRLVESSTRGERKEFYEMIEFAASQKETVAIIAYSVDRFQRRFDESINIFPLITKGQIEIHFIVPPLIINKETSSSNLMMWDFNVVGARAYILQLKESTQRGIRQKIKDGEWPGCAPIGYLNYMDGKYRKIKVDEERAPLVKSAFKEYASGLYSVDEITRHLRKNGLTTRGGKLVAKNTVHKMLQNPFYYGFMRIKEELIQHIYPPIIDKHLFDKCEQIRIGKGRHQPLFHQNDFIFKGLVKCDICGHLISPYNRIKKSGRKYVYLRCAKHSLDGSCPNPPINEDTALKRVTEGLNALCIDRELAEIIRQFLIKNNKQEAQQQVQSAKKAEKAVEEADRKIDRLIELQLSSAALPENLYKAKLQSLQEEKARWEALKRKNTVDEREFEVSVEEVLDLAKNAAEIFKSSQMDQKKQILNCVFANLTMKQKNLYFLYKKPFDLLVKGSFCPKMYRGRDLNP